MIEILTPGMFTTVQDLGRIGYAHLGVPRSGAADLRSLRLANRLVGNDESAACLEVTFGGVAMRFHQPTVVALTGAPAPARLGPVSVSSDRWLFSRAGDVLELGMPAEGVRTYVAVAGGVDVPPIMGSRSCDTLSGLGPPALRAGQHLAVGRPHQPAPSSPDCLASPVPYGAEVAVRYRRGPRDDWFSEATFDLFERSRWILTADSNRVGGRLSGPPIAVSREDQLPSEGMVLGSIEIPPSGQPIVFLADHPTTGGYPVIGVVEDDDVAVLAQTRPGASVRFVRQRPGQAARR